MHPSMHYGWGWVITAEDVDKIAEALNTGDVWPEEVLDIAFSDLAGVLDWGSESADGEGNGNVWVARQSDVFYWGPYNDPEGGYGVFHSHLNDPRRQASGLSMEIGAMDEILRNRLHGWGAELSEFGMFFGLSFG